MRQQEALKATGKEKAVFKDQGSVAAGSPNPLRSTGSCDHHIANRNN